MSAEILQTKLFVPPLRPDLVSRPRLIQALNAGLAGRLTLIPAPAGYGKTTLLSEWIAQLDRPVGWISLDSADNDQATFYSYLRAAVRAAVPEILPEPRDEAADLPAKLTRLINRLASSGQQLLLVLDDFQWITSKEVLSALVFLIDRMPPGLHIVISTRTDPPLRLALYRARMELTELRAADLQFNDSEAAQFLNGSMALNIAPEDVTLLNQKAEGWIAGLQLAAISIRSHPDPHAFVAEFTGGNRYIADYMLDEALRREPETRMAFLLDTSILDRLNASLCNAVTNREDSREVLQTLEQENLFLVPLDEHRLWFRYHHLFADLLSNRLRQLSRERVKTLYRRASEWHEQQSLLAEAVRFALLAGDSGRVANLMDGHALAVLSSSQLKTLNRLLADLPEDALWENPSLALARAWGLAFAGDIARGQSILKRIEQSISAYAPEIRGRIIVLKAYNTAARGDRLRSIRLARAALQILPEHELSMRSFTLLLLGNSIRFEGDLPGALEIHKKALRLSQQAGDDFLSIMIRSRMSDVRKTMGFMRDALQTDARAAESAHRLQQNTGLRSYILGYIQLQRSSIYYEQNELEKALDCVNDGLDLARDWGGHDTISLGYFNLAKIYQANGEFKRSFDVLEEFMNQHPDSGRAQFRFAQALESEIRVRSGNIPFGRAWQEDRRLEPSDPIPFSDIQTYFAFAELLLAEERWTEARQVISNLLELSDKSGAVEFAIRSLGMLARMQHAAGDDAAIETIGRALALAEPQGYRRSFLDQGQPMAEILYRASQRGLAADFCRELLSQFPVAEPMLHTALQPLVEPLSRRELEVLSQIAQGCRDREIASSLFLALSTVKSHARNIYGKLGVKNRTEAVAKARTLGILPPI